MGRDLFSELNESQREAVRYLEGPSLVIAGAGSGKTRVLTYKIAYILQQGLPASQILALTFTNKAAREMKERIENLLRSREARYLWMGTFHHICSMILRSEADKLGFTRNFTIYDTDDSKSLIIRIVKELKLDDKLYKASTVHNRISAAKNQLLSPKRYSEDNDCRRMDDQARMYRMSEVYAEYNKRLKAANAMDFDDLLYYTNVLLRDFPDVLQKYQEQFQFILVDEYQDTNFAQYLIIKKLAEQHHRVCVVGDDAQSIYSFRGANIYNILNFQKQYPEARLFKLEQNYRSTQNIVMAANTLIKNNKEQIEKNVYSMGDNGEQLHVISASTDIDEAEQTAMKIDTLRRKISLEDIAMLYRTNAQSRVLEQAMRQHGIPYRVYGGHSFYQRREIKDALAYLRLLVNNNDEESLTRIINVPTRGIGQTTVAKLLDCARANSVSVWQVVSNPTAYNLNVNGGTLKKIQQFADIITNAIEEMRTSNAYDVAKSLMERSGLLEDAKLDETAEGQARYENLQELLTGIYEFEEQIREGDEKRIVELSEFLSTVALQTDQDDKEEDQSEKVTMMTIHAAKGLEYKVVFILGMEEGLFPSDMQETEQDIEEERRLCYVAITRAKDLCYLGYAKQRFRNGKTTFCHPSRFLTEIDSKYIDNPPRMFQRQRYFGSYDYDFDDELHAWQGQSANFTRPDKREFTATPVETNIKPTGNTKPLGTPYIKSKKKNAQTEFEVGDKIRHENFGLGKIIEIYEENGNIKIDIDFKDSGRKTMLYKFARLVKMG